MPYTQNSGDEYGIMKPRARVSNLGIPNPGPMKPPVGPSVPEDKPLPIPGAPTNPGPLKPPTSPYPPDTDKGFPGAPTNPGPIEPPTRDYPPPVKSFAPRQYADQAGAYSFGAGLRAPMDRRQLGHNTVMDTLMAHLTGGA